MLWQEWWLWIVAGLILGIAEMLLPGFILMGFAIGAIVTGACLWLGWLGATLPATLVVFAIFSGLGWLALRLIFGRPWADQSKIWHKDINDN
jgi:inner membrane protein